MADRYGRGERDEAEDEIRTIVTGKSSYKGTFTIRHPKVTVHLSSEFRDFPDRVLDSAEDDIELAILDELNRHSKGLRSWRLADNVRRSSPESRRDVYEAMEALEDRGLIGHYRARSS